MAGGLAIVALGPSLGHILFSSHHPTNFWPSARPLLSPEPTEQARFVLALGVPLLMSFLTARATDRRTPLSPETTTRLVGAIQWMWLGILSVCLLMQRTVVFGKPYTDLTPSHRVYFTLPALMAAIAIGGVALALISVEPARARLFSLVREARWKRSVALLIAGLATIVWLLPSLYTEASVLHADPGVSFHVQFTYDETFSVVNGRAPLVNFPTQYGALVPYLAALVMTVSGTSLSAFTAIMSVLSGAALLAVFDLLRRVARSAVGAVILYLPFLATSGFLVHGSHERYSFLSYFGIFPLRIAGPYLVAWLTVRHLQAEDRDARSRWLLFGAGGLVILNNVDFGIPGFGATLAALLWTSRTRWRDDVRLLARDAAIGLAGALALVSMLTLARSGSLPHLGLIFEYARLFAVSGYNLLPMPAVGFHLVIYATFVAAIAVATVRAIASEPNRPLTGMLAWSGVFGLGASSYYVGRSHPDVLIALFSPWALTVALLAVVAVQRLMTLDVRRPGGAAVAIAVAFGLATCSIAQTPLPWQQIRQLVDPRPSDGHDSVAWFQQVPRISRFIASTARPGEPVAILLPLGHVIAERADLVNVAPYTGFYSMPMPQQLDDVVDALRRAHGTRLYLSADGAWSETSAELLRLGFKGREVETVRGRASPSSTLEFVDGS